MTKQFHSYVSTWGTHDNIYLHKDFMNEPEKDFAVCKKDTEDHIQSCVTQRLE